MGYMNDGRKIYKCDRCGWLEHHGGICPECHKGILSLQKEKFDITIDTR